MPKVKKPRSRQNDKAISKKRSVEAPEAVSKLNYDLVVVVLYIYRCPLPL